MPVRQLPYIGERRHKKKQYGMCIAFKPFTDGLFINPYPYILQEPVSTGLKIMSVSLHGFSSGGMRDAHPSVVFGTTLVK